MQESLEGLIEYIRERAIKDKTLGRKQCEGVARTIQYIFDYIKKLKNK